MSAGARRGFTLIEALLAIVLAALLFGGISAYTGTWLGRWSSMLDRGTREDTVSVVLDRIVEDLESARPVFEDKLFEGDPGFEGHAATVTFLRDAFGYGPRPGMDSVTYSNSSVGRQSAVVRSRRNFPGSQRGEDLPLIRGDGRLELAYAGPDGAFAGDWADRWTLPSYVRITISGSQPRPWSQTAFATIRSAFPAGCGAKERFQQCRDAAAQALQR